MEAEVKKKEEPPLPETGISEILGFIELLKSKGGRADIYKLADELQMELGETLSVIRGAELLGFVNTPGGDVVLESLGDRVSKAKINKRKEIICERLEAIPLFRRLTEYLSQKEDHEATKDEVLEKLAEFVPNENAEQTFSTLVHWGRYAELFGYNDDDHCFYIDDEEDEEA